jgi:hypothetical protein
LQAARGDTVARQLGTVHSGPGLRIHLPVRHVGLRTILRQGRNHELIASSWRLGLLHLQLAVQSPPLSLAAAVIGSGDGVPETHKRRSDSAEQVVHHRKLKRTCLRGSCCVRINMFALHEQVQQGFLWGRSMRACEVQYRGRLTAGASAPVRP